MTGEAQDARLDADAIKLIGGNPSDEELAAVVAVLSTQPASERPAEVTSGLGDSEWIRTRRSLRNWSHEARWR